LGALTAKILTAGAARVIVTYALGRDDADALVSEINGFAVAPVASALRYDMMDGAVPVVEGVTHLYHFASPAFTGRSRCCSMPVCSQNSRVRIWDRSTICVWHCR
jgi:hypothetical protein